VKNTTFSYNSSHRTKHGYFSRETQSPRVLSRLDERFVFQLPLRGLLNVLRKIITYDGLDIIRKNFIVRYLYIYIYKRGDMVFINTTPACYDNVYIIRFKSGPTTTMCVVSKRAIRRLLRAIMFIFCYLYQNNTRHAYETSHTTR